MIVFLFILRSYPLFHIIIIRREYSLFYWGLIALLVLIALSIRTNRGNYLANLMYWVSFSCFHKPLEIRSVFLCFPQLFSAFIPPTRENLCPKALLAAVSAAAAYGIELDAPRPVAEERPLLPCVLFHILSPSFFC